MIRFKETERDRFAANVVYPEVYRDAVARGADIASRGAPSNGPGVLVLASALNLLMFSPTWGSAITDELVALMQEGELTTLFSVSEIARSSRSKVIPEISAI